MSGRTIGLFVVLGALLCVPALGATFHLADGKVIEGEIKRQDPTSVTITFDEGGVGTFERGDFAKETRVEVFGKGPAPGQQTWGNMPMLEKIMVGVMVVGVVSTIAAELWFIAAGFGVSTGWGVALLLCGGLRNIYGAIYVIVVAIWFADWHGFPPEIAAAMIAFGCLMGVGGVLFIFRHWDRAQGPVCLDILGILMIVGSMLYSM